MTSPSFTSVRLDTNLIEREQDWIANAEMVPAASVVMATLGVLEREAGEADQSPWGKRDGWRMNSTQERTVRLVSGEKAWEATVSYRAAGYGMRIGERLFEVSGGSRAGGGSDVEAVIDGERVRARVVKAGARYHVFLDGRHVEFAYDDPLDVEAQHQAGEGSLLAPMPGRVVALVAEPGQRVEKGAPLMVLEAMKMECTIHAPAAGRVQSFHFAAGDQVSEGVELLHFTPEDTSENGNG